WQISAGADFSNGKPQDTAQSLSVCGMATPSSQTNQAGSVPASTNRSLLIAHGTGSSGTSKSIVAILDGLTVKALGCCVTCRLQFESVPTYKLAAVRITAARAPPEFSFAR